VLFVSAPYVTVVLSPFLKGPVALFRSVFVLVIPKKLVVEPVVLYPQEFIDNGPAVALLLAGIVVLPFVRLLFVVVWTYRSYPAGSVDVTVIVCDPAPLKVGPLGCKANATLPPKLIDRLVSDPKGTSAPKAPCPNGAAAALADKTHQAVHAHSPTATAARDRSTYFTPAFSNFIPQV
jgi:hypothetical protein